MCNHSVTFFKCHILHTCQPSYFQQKHMNFFVVISLFTSIPSLILNNYKHMHLVPTPITTIMLGCIPLYMVKNQTKKLHKNSREQNLAFQKMWGTTMLGCIPLYMMKNQPKHYVIMQGSKTRHFKKCGAQQCWVSYLCT